jgi:hypothetical protein
MSKGLSSFLLFLFLSISFSFAFFFSFAHVALLLFPFLGLLLVLPLSAIFSSLPKHLARFSPISSPLVVQAFFDNLDRTQSKLPRSSRATASIEDSTWQQRYQPWSLVARSAHIQVSPRSYWGALFRPEGQIPSTETRNFWSKEVDPGSSRSNSTNIYFSKWVKIHGTVPKCTDTVETMKVFLRRTSEPELYATVFIPELQISSQPLVYAQWQHGRLQQASVDHHISNIVKRAIRDTKMGRMMTAHIRGASVSKIVQLVPDLTDQALALGRWTTPHTFRNHYQAPVLGTWAKVPKSICNPKADGTSVVPRL